MSPRARRHWTWGSIGVAVLALIAFLQNVDARLSKNESDVSTTSSAIAAQMGDQIEEMRYRRYVDHRFRKLERAQGIAARPYIGPPMPPPSEKPGLVRRILKALF